MSDDLLSYMRRHGWRRSSTGSGGELWARENDSRLATDLVGVPSDLRPGTLEWAGVIARLAVAQHLPAESVQLAVQHEHLDVTNFRAVNEGVIDRSIPLTSGLQLLESARAMLRATATTAQRTRAHISGGYSKTGDALASRARMGHTIDGSYVIPVLMPVPEATTLVSDAEPFESMTVDKVAPESAERRVTRTLAEALTAVQRRIVEPARLPTSSDIVPLVAAGVSREFVQALSSIVQDAAVSTFHVSFTWAGVAAPPTGIPEEVQIPREAGELLDEAARRLRSVKDEPAQSITGPIIEVHHLPEDESGWIGVQTVRSGRTVTVRVWLTAAEVMQALDFMRRTQTVVVAGRPIGGRGKPLEIRKPDRFASLEETMLPSH